jgi:hypothetical protein
MLAAKVDAVRHPPDVRSGSKPVLTAPKRDFCSTPINGHRQTAPACLKGAKAKPVRCDGQTIGDVERR